MWRVARPRLFVVVRVQQQLLELLEGADVAAHLDFDDSLGLIVIVGGTRLVEIRLLMYRWPRSDSLAHRGTISMRV